MLSILPRFVALEMIADMSSLEDELSPHEFHKIYIHQYKDVRWALRQDFIFFLPGVHQDAQLIVQKPFSDLQKTGRLALCLQPPEHNAEL